MGKDLSMSFSPSSSTEKKKRREKKLHKSLENNDADNVLGEETTYLKGDLEPKVNIDISQCSSQVILSQQGHAKKQKTQASLENKLIDRDLRGSADISSLNPTNMDHFLGEDVPDVATSDATGIKKNFNEPLIKDSVSEDLCGTSDMTVDVSLKDEKTETGKRKKHVPEEVELDLTGIEKIKTYKRKKDISEMADLDPMGRKENLEESMLKSPVSGNLCECDVNQIIDNSSIKEHDIDLVVRDISLKDEEAKTHKRMKRQESYHQEKDSTPQILHLSPPRPLVTSSRRKLLILDVNGLLSDFVPYAPRGHTADIIISNKSVFKRPFCDEFVQFCFQKFDVGVWSSRTRHNLDKAVDFLLGDSKQQLLFCWDQAYCTDTGFNTLGARSKPLFLKELRKLWEKHKPDVPWEKGYYNESNTLLLDDTPYKALRNPLYTAIFPPPYTYNDREDNSLGPGGSLRVYLEGLVMAENVQTYVEQNPFGQRAVTEANASWGFYSKVRGDNF